MGLNRSEGGTDKAARLPKGWTGPVSTSGTQAAKAAWVFFRASGRFRRHLNSILQSLGCDVPVSVANPSFISSHLVYSSHLISSHLISSHLVSSRLISSPNPPPWTRRDETNRNPSRDRGRYSTSRFRRSISCRSRPRLLRSNL